jgi:hypothetical protein
MQGARPWAWVIALLLLAGSVTGWLMGRDAGPAQQTDATQAETSIEGTRAIAIPRQIRATEPPGERDPERSVTSRLDPTPAAPARVSRGAERHRLRLDRSIPRFFLKEAK